MADISYDTQSAPVTPAAGAVTIWPDTAKVWAQKDDAGRCAVLTGSTTNAAIAAVTGFAADTYVVDSHLLIPSFGLQVRTQFMWMISASKTAAGVATPTYILRFGANKSTADTAVLTLTGPAQTAIADIGTLYVMATVRSIGASGVIQATAWWVHRGTAANTTTSGTGFANDTTGHVEGTSAGFDMSTSAGKYIGLSLNGGASASWTTTQAQAEAIW